jgi:hypothetical protein
MTITYEKGLFVAHSIFDENEKLKQAGFRWHADRKKWISEDYRSADKLLSYCDSIASFQIKFFKEGMQKSVQQSASAVGNFPVYHNPQVTPFPYQHAGVEYILPRPAVILADEMGLGKLEFVENKIFTPTGRKRIGDVIIGDKVIGSDGNAYNITGVFPQGIKDLYRVTFNDGASVLVGLDHLWTVFTRNIHRGRKDGYEDRTIVLTTGQLLDRKLKMSLKGTDWNEKRPYEFSTYYVEKNGNLKWQIPIVKPINFTNKDVLPIEPYLLGLTLGDGHIRGCNVHFTIHKNDFDEIFKYYQVKEKNKNAKRPNVRFCSINLKAGIEFLGLQGKKSNDKFIPDIYKYSSIDNRISILQGLMDTDGHCMIGKKGKKKVFSGTEYCTVSEQLAKDVCEIVHSLGGIARLKIKKQPAYIYKGKKKTGKQAYRINIKMPDGINPFRLKRKADRYSVPEKYNVARYIKDIKFEKIGEAVCIQVDAPDQLYVTEHGIVTHNTGQALIVMNMRHPVEALIVCPSILKYNWLKEARKWMIGHITAYIYESKKIRYYKARLTNHDKNTVLHIINYDILEKFKDRLLDLPINFFIADESHYIKNQDAKRTKIAQQLARKAKWKIFITGTPIYNKPKDLYVALNLIDPEMFDNFYMFATKYCGAKKVKFNGKSVMKYDGPTNVDELNTILRANYMVRRMKKDVMKDLPEKMKDVIILNESDLDGLVEKEKKVLADSKEKEEKLKAEVEELRELVKTNKEYETIYKDKVKSMREIKFKNFGELSRIRKELAVKKVPYVTDFVKEMLDNDEDQQSKIVVFGHHTEVLESIYMALIKYGPVIITGKTNDAERQRAISLFKEKNNTRVFIGSMGAAGTGVDGLQTNCSTVVFAELDWTPSLVDQAESRLQRIGQKNTVWVYHIVANDSIDSRIVKLMMEKEAVSKEILDFRPEELYDKLVQVK